MPSAMQVASKACYKLVADMLYKARVQAVVDYKSCIKKVNVGKPDARNIRLTPWEQFLRVSVQHY